MNLLSALIVLWCAVGVLSLVAAALIARLEVQVESQECRATAAWNSVAEWPTSCELVGLRPDSH